MFPIIFHVVKIAFKKYKNIDTSNKCDENFQWSCVLYFYIN